MQAALSDKHGNVMLNIFSIHLVLGSKSEA